MDRDAGEAFLYTGLGVTGLRQYCSSSIQPEARPEEEQDAALQMKRESEHIGHSTTWRISRMSIPTGSLG